MRPTTPKFRAQAGPNSPPATPTTTTAPNFSNSKSRRNGVMYNFSQHTTPLSTQQDHRSIIPNADQPFTFSYNPFQPLDLELSPRSSSPASTTPSSNSYAGIDSPRPRSRSSSPEPHYSSPPKLEKETARRVIKEGTFTIEELDENEAIEYTDIIRPHQYEDVDSASGRSVNGLGPGPSREIDPEVLHGMKDLRCEVSEDEVLSEREAWLQKQKEVKRRKRRSSGVSKRSHALSLGSDTDDADVQPVYEGVNEVGSSARRLRRKVGDRSSLIFDDPPARIEELEEPESCEELVEVDDCEIGLKDLPYYVQEHMEVDSDE